MGQHATVQNNEGVLYNLICNTSGHMAKSEQRKTVTMSRMFMCEWLWRMSEEPSTLFNMGKGDHWLKVGEWRANSLYSVNFNFLICSCICTWVLSCSVVSSYSVAPWTVASQASLSMEFPRQEYWSGLPFPSPGVLPDSGIEPWEDPLASSALAGRFFIVELPGKTLFMYILLFPYFKVVVKSMWHKIYHHNPLNSFNLGCGWFVMRSFACTAKWIWYPYTHIHCH